MNEPHILKDCQISNETQITEKKNPNLKRTLNFQRNPTHEHIPNIKRTSNFQTNLNYEWTPIFER